MNQFNVFNSLWRYKVKTTTVVNLFLLLFWSLVCFVASDFLTTICHLAILNVCVIIVLSIGNTQISILLLCFLYLFVELMITMNEYICLNQQSQLLK